MPSSSKCLMSVIPERGGGLRKSSSLGLLIHLDPFRVGRRHRSSVCVVQTSSSFYTSFHIHSMLQIRGRRRRHLRRSIPVKFVILGANNEDLQIDGRLTGKRGASLRIHILR